MPYLVNLINRDIYKKICLKQGEDQKVIDFSKVDIKSLTIEHNNEKEHLDSIVNIMKDTKLYKETDRNCQDIYYAKL